MPRNTDTGHNWPTFDEELPESPLPASDFFTEREAMFQLWREDEYGEPPSGADLKEHYLEFWNGCYLPKTRH